MADNLTLNAGSGGATVATDDVGGVHYPISKLCFGALNTVTMVAAAEGLPVAQEGTWSLTNISGTISLPTGAATEATLSSFSAKVTACNTGAVVVASGVITTITNPVAVTGTFWQATQPVSGTFWQATQPVSAASLPLPTGAATETTLATIAASFATESTLATLDGKVAACNTGAVVIASGTVTANMGTVTADPFGANADAGSATGSISAKLRFIAATGIPVTAQPARAATTDNVGAKLATDAIMNGTSALTPKFAFANVAAAQTDSNVVTAVANKKIRVLQTHVVTGATATNITFNSKPAGAGTAISSLAANAANGGSVRPFSPIGWFETVAGEGLTVTTGAGSTTGIEVVYVEV
jgi:hypothetical protein